MFFALPVALGAFSVGYGFEIDETVATALLTVSGLFSAFLFGVCLQIYGRAEDFADSRPTPGETTSTNATNLVELAANAAYSSLVSIAAAIVYVFASATSGWFLRIATALGLFIGSHLVLVLFMVMRRLFLRIEGLLVRARTGADRRRHAA